MGCGADPETRSRAVDDVYRIDPSYRRFGYFARNTQVSPPITPKLGSRDVSPEDDAAVDPHRPVRHARAQPERAAALGPGRRLAVAGVETAVDLTDDLDPFAAAPAQTTARK